MGYNIEKKIHSLLTQRLEEQRKNKKTTPTLPTWVPRCLRNDFSELKKTTSPKQVFTPFGDSKAYFFQDYFFRLYDENNTMFEGTWECQGNNVLIKTKDGDEYSIPTYGGWKSNKQSNIDNTTPPDNTGTPTPTPKKRGTQLSGQDFEGINFKYNYPGDKNYVYGVKNKEWYAKNKNNGKVFNISKDGFTSSVDKLNSKFPEAFKEVEQPVSPEIKTPVTTQDSTKVVTNVPPQVKFVDSTTYKLEKL